MEMGHGCILQLISPNLLPVTIWSNSNNKRHLPCATFSERWLSTTDMGHVLFHLSKDNSGHCEMKCRKEKPSHSSLEGR